MCWGYKNVNLEKLCNIWKARSRQAWSWAEAEAVQEVPWLGFLASGIVRLRFEFIYKARRAEHRMIPWLLH